MKATSYISLPDYTVSEEASKNHSTKVAQN